MSVNIDYDTAQEILDYLYTLKGEWSWKEDEPRAGNQRDYHQLCSTIRRTADAVRDYENREKKGHETTND